MKNKTEIPAAEAAHAAKQASFALAAAPGKARSSALLAVAAALHAKANMVFKANEIDMRQAEKEGLAAPALKRLKFDAHKLEDVCAGLEQLAAMEDPIGREQLRTELADGLVLSRVSCPIGVIGVIFESRPDALVQIGGLCLKSGNAVLLKGGREAMRTNEALFDILRDASVATGMPDGWCGLLTTREDVSVMLKMDEDIDLIIPRGSNAFVRYIMENSNIPVLGHSDGVCHVYVDADCDAQMAARIVTDAKTQYPAACNAAEMLLVHSAQLANALPAIARALTEAGVTLRADSRARAALYAAGVASEAGDESDWGREYLALTEDEGFHWGVLRGGMGSVAMLFVAQLQDYLGLGAGHRMNTPGTQGGNWTWRLLEGELTPALAKKIRRMTELYGRAEKLPQTTDE